MQREQRVDVGGQLGAVRADAHAQLSRALELAAHRAQPLDDRRAQARQQRVAVADPVQAHDRKAGVDDRSRAQQRVPLLAAAQLLGEQHVGAQDPQRLAQPVDGQRPIGGRADRPELVTRPMTDEARDPRAP